MRFQTYQEALEMVKRNGLLLRDIPAKILTVELCLTAVKQNDAVLEYVPKALKSADIYLAAMKQCLSRPRHFSKPCRPVYYFS